MPTLKRCDRCQQTRNFKVMCRICGQNYGCGSLGICCRCRERGLQKKDEETERTDD
jgi:hypothetical protein